MFSHDFQQNYCATINTFTPGIFLDDLIKKNCNLTTIILHLEVYGVDTCKVLYQLHRVTNM